MTHIVFVTMMEAGGGITRLSPWSGTGKDARRTLSEWRRTLRNDVVLNKSCGSTPIPWK